MGLFKKLFSREKKETLDKGLEKTKQGVFEKIKHAVAGKSTVDDDVLDNLEEVFVTSDVGVDTTVKIIDRLQARVARDKYVGTCCVTKSRRCLPTTIMPNWRTSPCPRTANPMSSWSWA